MLLFRGLRLIVGQVSPVRFIGPFTTLVGLLALGFAAFTGNLDFSKFDIPKSMEDVAGAFTSGTSGNATVQPVRLDRNAPRAGERIRIATFNIQRFGEKKSADAEVMQNIALIVANFDFVAIQEVQSPQAMPIARLHRNQFVHLSVFLLLQH